MKEKILSIGLGRELNNVSTKLSEVNGDKFLDVYIERVKKFKRGDILSNDRNDIFIAEEDFVAPLKGETFTSFCIVGLYDWELHENSVWEISSFVDYATEAQKAELLNEILFQNSKIWDADKKELKVCAEVGDLVLCWDSDIRNARVEILKGESGLIAYPYYTTNGSYSHIVKWDGTKQMLIEVRERGGDIE